MASRLGACVLQRKYGEAEEEHAQLCVELTRAYTCNLEVYASQQARVQAYKQAEAARRSKVYELSSLTAQPHRCPYTDCTQCLRLQQSLTASHITYTASFSTVIEASQVLLYCTSRQKHSAHSTALLHTGAGVKGSIRQGYAQQSCPA